MGSLRQLKSGVKTETQETFASIVVPSIVEKYVGISRREEIAIGILLRLHIYGSAAVIGFIIFMTVDAYW
jgi:hypothetical protein